MDNTGRVTIEVPRFLALGGALVHRFLKEKPMTKQKSVTIEFINKLLDLERWMRWTMGLCMVVYSTWGLLINHGENKKLKNLYIIWISIGSIIFLFSYYSTRFYINHDPEEHQQEEQQDALQLQQE